MKVEINTDYLAEDVNTMHNYIINIRNNEFKTGCFNPERAVVLSHVIGILKDVSDGIYHQKNISECEK